MAIKVRNVRTGSAVMAVMLLTASGTLAAQAAVRSHHSASRIIRACVSTRTHRLIRLYVSGDTPCPTGSYAVSWNQRGRAGTSGSNGTSLSTGTTAPSGTCSTGDTYLDLAANAGVPAGEAFNCVAGAWVDSGYSLEGPPGAKGANGAIGPPGTNGTNGTDGTNGTNGTNGVNGNSILSGSTTPADSVGNNGDFYLDTATETLYGPKAAGSWPATGTSLIGPKGDAGTGATFLMSAGTGSLTTDSTGAPRTELVLPLSGVGATNFTAGSATVGGVGEAFPITGSVTSLAVQCRCSTPGSGFSGTSTVTAQLYLTSTSTPFDPISPVAGAACALSPALTASGVTVMSCSVSGLSVAVTPGMQGVIVFSVTNSPSSPPATTFAYSGIANAALTLTAG